MHRFLERLDAAGTTLVPLAYLAGLVGGTMAYFTGIRLGFGLAVGISLAVASELHSFLQQRRTRATWGVLARTSPDDPHYAGLRRQLFASACILTALLLFQTFTSMAFVAETWTPARGYLPGWLQVGIRGAVVPFLLLLAGFLAPLTVDASAVLSRASGDMLHKAIRATVKQWNHRIDRARRQGLDLAPIAVALMLDAGDTDGARRVQMIAEGLNVAEGVTSSSSVHAAAAPGGAVAAMDMETFPAIAAPITSTRTGAQMSTPDAPEQPPTGAGAPVATMPRASKRRRSDRNRPRVLRVLSDNANAEQRIRALLKAYPTMSIRTLAKRAHVAESTASKWRGIVAAEQQQQRERDRSADDSQRQSLAR